MSQFQQDVGQQDQLVRLADRTARAVETIRTVVILWAILTTVALLVVLALISKAANGA